MTPSPPRSPALHRRRYAPDTIVPTADLQELLVVAAELVELNTAYAPIFLRIERELQAREGQESLLDRARRISRLRAQSQPNM